MTKKENKLKELTELIKPAFSLEQLKTMNVPENEINDYMKFHVFPISILVKAVWNYKEENENLTSKLIANIKQNGQVENIQVRLLDTGYYEIVNGNHRLDAMLSLGREFIVCYNHGSISDSKAKRIAIETNETRFATDSIKLADLIKEISTDFDISDLESTMPYNETELNNFIELTNFDWDQFSKQPEDSEDEKQNSKDIDLDFVELKLNLTKEVFDLWEEYKKRVKENTQDKNLSDNKCFEFAMAESLSTITG